MKKFTILGSCRQQALYRLSAVTSLQEKVSYPHSSKEILEMLRYCKRGGISPEDTVRTFRTPILTQQSLHWTTEIREEIETSEIVVVEIASRRAYRYEGRYVHHILYDDPSYRLPEEEFGKICVEIVDDVTIEKDLLAIRAELGSHQQLVVVTHLVTERKGTRYELVKLLERICERQDILCIQPAEEMERRGDSLIEYVMPEDHSTHFTEAGHEKMQEIFRDLLFPSYEKTVVLAWTRNVCNLEVTPTDNFWGLGDLIRGALNMYEETRMRGLGFYLDIHLHPALQIHLRKKTHPFSSRVGKQYDKIPFVLSEDMDHFLSNLNTDMTPLMTNYSTGQESSYDARAFVRYHLTPSVEMEARIDQVQQRFSLQSGKYSVLHYRLGDEELVQHQNPHHKLMPHIESLQRVMEEQGDKDEQFLFLSDSESFKSAVRSLSLPKLVILDTKVQHSGHPSSDDLCDTMMEFFLASRARTLQTYSVYPWISGFMRSVHELYQIPLVDIKGLTHPITRTPRSMILMTGSDAAYVPSLRNLLDSFVEHCCTRYTNRVLHVHDLGWTTEQKDALQKDYADQYPFQIIFKTFDFSFFPEWMHIKNDAGQYAWKSVILYETMMHHGLVHDTIMVWMDARNFMLNTLDKLEGFVLKHGVYSGTSAGTVKDWTHPGTLKAFKVEDNNPLLTYENRNAACIAVDPTHPIGSSLVRELYHYCLIQDCIAPTGSSRNNHRQDQAVFTILFYRLVKDYDHKIGDQTLGFYYHYQK